MERVSGEEEVRSGIGSWKGGGVITAAHISTTQQYGIASLPLSIHSDSLLLIQQESSQIMYTEDGEKFLQNFWLKTMLLISFQLSLKTWVLFLCMGLLSISFVFSFLFWTWTTANIHFLSFFLSFFIYVLFCFAILALCILQYNLLDREGIQYLQIKYTPYLGFFNSWDNSSIFSWKDKSMKILSTSDTPIY